MVSTKITPQIIELSDSDIQTPTLLKNKILMAPGLWNGKRYTANEIKKAFENTDWHNRDSFGPNAIIADHADKPLKVGDWFGYVKNAHMDGDNLMGDLELYDENIITKLVKGKATFGISPRLQGEAEGEFEGAMMKNFVFENFSVVSNPACKSAYINLSEKEKLEKSSSIKSKGGIKMSEQETEDKKVEEESKDEVKEEEKEEESKLSDEEILEVTTKPEWSGFAASLRSKDPKMTVREMAMKFKEKDKELSELEELSVDEILSRMEKLGAILKKKKYPMPEDKKEEMKENKELAELKKTVAELSQKLNEPAPKTVQSSTEELSSKRDFTIHGGMNSHYSPAVLAMADFIKQFK